MGPSKMNSNNDVALEIERSESPPIETSIGDLPKPLGVPNVDPIVPQDFQHNIVTRNEMDIEQEGFSLQDIESMGVDRSSIRSYIYGLQDELVY